MPIFNVKNKKILFIHIPKNYGTLIEKNLNKYSKNKIILKHNVKNLKYLFGNHKPYHLQHLTLQQVFEITDYNIDDFDIIFTILRDPVKKFLSEINWCLNSWYFKKIIHKKNQTNEDFIEEKITKYIESNNSSFSHDLPQYKFIEGFEDKIKIFTDLQQVHDFFLKELNIDIDINNKINKSKHIANLPKNYDYNKIFYKDILLFNKYKTNN